MRSLMWFRHDLRIQDNTALWHATQHAPTIAIVFLSAEMWKKHDDALIKIDFYLRQLKQLQMKLNQLNIPLYIEKIASWDEIPTHIQNFIQNHQINAVYANIELGVNELKRDTAVQNQLNLVGKDLILYHDRTIFPVGSIRTQSNQPYQVFTPFKKKCYENLNISIPQPYPKPNTQIAFENFEQLNSQIPNLSDFYLNEIDEKQHNLWQVGEEKALDLLCEFAQNRLKNYAQQRDYPRLNATSQIGVYLNIGVLSIRQCLQAIFANTQGQFVIENEGQQTWLSELIWREFYQHILFDFPQVSKNQPFKANTQHIQWRYNEQHLHAWQQGQTGIPIVDAGMRELLATGWMHNRVRMITAMFFSKNLFLDWRLGEKWFMQHLIDGDLAANNGGWQWCASTGTDAAPYFRIFNPISQSQKFDEQGDYIRRWVPELAHLNAKNIHEPYAQNPNLRLNYPQPIVDLKQTRQYAIDAFKALSV